MIIENYGYVTYAFLFLNFIKNKKLKLVWFGICFTLVVIIFWGGLVFIEVECFDFFRCLNDFREGGLFVGFES